MLVFGTRRVPFLLDGPCSSCGSEGPQVGLYTRDWLQLGVAWMGSIQQCSICFDELAERLTAAPCGHVFHTEW